MQKGSRGIFFITYFINDMPLLCHFILVTDADQQWCSVGEDYRSCEYMEGSESVGDILGLAITILNKILPQYILKQTEISF